MHAVAVVFDFVEPLVAFRRSVDQLGELRPDPFRKRDGVCAALAGYAARHANGTERLSGRRMRLGVDGGLRHDLAWSEFLRRAVLEKNLSTICETEFNRTAFRLRASSGGEAHGSPRADFRQG
jgi:hypothetical protein